MASCGPERCEYCGNAPCEGAEIGLCPAREAAELFDVDNWNPDWTRDDDDYDPDDDQSWMDDAP